MKTNEITPTVYRAPPPAQAQGTWLNRSVGAILFERRCPYQVQQWLDRNLNRIGFQQKTVRAGDLRFRVRRRTQDERFVQNIVVNHDYTPPGFEIPHDATVIDIGANIGSFTLLASRQARSGHVFSFEPNAANYAVLQSNLTLNNISNVTPRHCAVTGRPGPVRLYNGGDSGMHSIWSSRSNSADGYEEVEGMTLSQIFDEAKIVRCHFLKMDCEGAEYDILYNTPQQDLDRIDKIVMEYHAPSRDEKRECGDGLVRFLRQHHFEVVDYIDFADFLCGFIRARKPSR